MLIEIIRDHGSSGKQTEDNVRPENWCSSELIKFNRTNVALFHCSGAAHFSRTRVSAPHNQTSQFPWRVSQTVGPQDLPESFRFQPESPSLTGLELKGEAHPALCAGLLSVVRCADSYRYPSHTGAKSCRNQPSNSEWLRNRELANQHRRKRTKLDRRSAGPRR